MDQGPQHRSGCVLFTGPQEDSLESLVSGAPTEEKGMVVGMLVEALVAGFGKEVAFPHFLLYSISLLSNLCTSIH